MMNRKVLFWPLAAMLGLTACEKGLVDGVADVAPAGQALTVGGTFATAGTSSTIALTRQEDNRTWTLPSLSGEGSTNQK